jgi:hypothetical protein
MAAVLIVLIIVAALAGGYYLTSAPSGGHNTSTSTSQTSAYTTSTTSTESAFPSSSSSPGSTTSTSAPAGSTSSSTTSQVTPSSTSSSTDSKTSATSQTSTSTITTACSSSSTTSTTNGTALALAQLNFVPLVGNFSSMTVKGSSTETDSHDNSSFSVAYTRLYASPTTFKVNETAVEDGNSVYGNFSNVGWVLRNGTVIAIEESLEGLEQNITGGSGTLTAQMEGQMAPFAVESAEYYSFLFGSSSGSISSSSMGIINSTNVMIGPTSAHVTNYGYASLPVTVVSSCSTPVTYLRAALQIGTVAGSAFHLVTIFRQQYFFGSSNRQTFGTTFEITSLTR